MKRIISFVLCLSMLCSMLPVNVFAADVDETDIIESTPVTEEVPEETEAVAETGEPTEAPAETEEPTVPASTETAVETTAAATEATQAAETVPAVTEDTMETEPTEAEETIPEATEEAFTVTNFTIVPKDTDLPSDDELLAGYLDQQFFGGISLLGNAAGEALEGDLKMCYDALVSEIQKIAAGKRDTSVISVGHRLSDEYVPDVEKALTGTTLTQEGLDGLLAAILADLPYELYWFDKTSTGGISGSYVCSSDGRLFITFYLMVSEDYSQQGTLHSTDLDTEKTSCATESATAAKNLVAKYTDKSDYEKLVAYKEEICALTDYNHSAASSSYTGEYGDPWQLIHVFDGDDSTKVVCEGYAKAFQYLCDLSEFEGNVLCYNVVGTMGSEKHMWNIVTIGENNYLVDVTNSDDGHIGDDGGLFLVGKAANSDGSYTFCGYKYTYNSSTKSLWGTGEGSILLLAEENYDPDVTSQTPESGSGTESEGFTGPAIVLSETTIYGSPSMVGSVIGTLSEGDIVEIDRCETVSDVAWAYITDPTAGWIMLEYVQAVVPEPESPNHMTGKELLAALESSSDYQYILTEPLVIDYEVTLPAGKNVTANNPNISITVTENGKLTIPLNAEVIVLSGAPLNVEAGGTLVVNGGLVINGSSVATIDGTLENNQRVEVSYASLKINGEYCTSVNYSRLTQDFHSEITNVDPSIIDIVNIAPTADSLEMYLEVWEGYKSQKVNVANFSTDAVKLTKDLTVPEGITLQVGTYEYTTAKLIVGEGVTLTNNGTITLLNNQHLTVEEGGKLVNNGGLTNNGTITAYGMFVNNGPFEGNDIVDPNLLDEADFLEALSQAEGTYVLEKRVKISSGLTIPDGITLDIAGTGASLELLSTGSLTVEEEGLILVRDGAVLITNEGSTLTINGTTYDPMKDTGIRAFNGGGIYLNGNVTNNGALRMDRTSDIGGELVIGGSIANYGYLQVVYPSVMTINGDLTNNDMMQVAGMVDISGTVTNYGLIMVDEPGKNAGIGIASNARVYNYGTLQICDGCVMTIHGMLDSSNKLLCFGTLEIMDTGSVCTGNQTTIGGRINNNGELFLNRHSVIDGFVVNSGTVHFSEDAIITVNGTLVNHGYIDGYDFALSVTGTLYNQGGSIDVWNGSYAIAEKGRVQNTLMPSDYPYYIGELSDYQTLFCETDDFTELLRYMARGERYKVQVNTIGTMTADDCITIPSGCLWNIYGTVTVPAEYQISNYGTVNVGNYNDKFIGKLILKGSLKNFHTGGVLNIEAGATMDVDGGLFNGTETNVYGTLIVDGKLEGYAPNIYEGGKVDYDHLAQMQFEQLLKEAEAEGHPAKLTESLTLTRNLTVNCVLEIAEGATLTIPSGKTLTNNGTIHLSGGKLTVSSKGKLVNYNILSNNGGTLTIASGGTYSEGDEITAINNHYVNGKASSVSGIAKSKQTLCANAATEADVQGVLALTASGGYRGSNITVQQDLTLEKDLTLPANAFLTVKSGATLTMNGRLTAEADADVVVLSGGTLILNAPENVNRCDYFHIMGTLQLGDSCQLINEHGNLDVDGTCEFGQYAYVVNRVITGWAGSVSGIPEEKLYLETYPETMADVVVLLDTFNEGGYTQGTIYVDAGADFTITTDIELPKDVSIQVNNQDDNGTEVTLTIDEGVTVVNHGSISIQDTNALVLEGCLINHGILSVQKDASLELGAALGNYHLLNLSGSVHQYADGRLNNHGGTVTLGENSYDPESGYGTVFNHLNEGRFGTVTNVPKDHLILFGSPASTEELVAMTQEFDPDTYAEGRILIMEDLEISADITLPDGMGLWIQQPEDSDESVTVTIQDGTVFTNEGGIYIHKGAELIVNGSLTGNLPELHGGSCGGSFFELSGSEKDAFLEELKNPDCVELTLNKTLVLTEDCDVNCTELIIGAYGNLVVSGGSVLNNYTQITITDKGRMTVNGELHNYGPVNVTRNGELLVNGHADNENEIVVQHWGTLDAENGTFWQAANGAVTNVHRGSYSEETSHATVLGIHPSYINVVVEGNDEALIRELMGYAETLGQAPKNLHINIFGELTLASSLSLPDYATMAISGVEDFPGLLTVPQNVTLTNNGRIILGQHATLHVLGTYEGKMPMVTNPTGEFKQEGKLALTHDELQDLLYEEDYAVISTTMVLTKDLYIPSDCELIITKGGKLIVPYGKTLYNNGFINIQLGGELSLENRNGFLENEGFISVSSSGILRAVSSNSYIHNDGAELHSIWYTDGSGSIQGILPQYVTLEVGGCDESLIRQVLDEAETMAQNGIYPTVKICFEGDLTLKEDLILPEYAVLILRDTVFEVPENVTLTNNGHIELYGGGVLTVSGEFTGSQPAIMEFGGVFDNTTDYSEEALWDDIEAAALTGREVFLNEAITLSQNLKIPEGVVLTISQNGSITIPEGMTLTNNGRINTQLFGGIIGDGGTLKNNGLIYNSNWGVTDMTSGAYVHGDGAKLYKVHYTTDPTYHPEHNPDSRTGAEVIFSDSAQNQYITVVAEGCSEENIREMLAYCEGIAQGEYYPALEIHVTGGTLNLANDLTIPHYARMIIENKGDGLGYVEIRNGVHVYNHGGIDILNGGYLTVLSDGTLENYGGIRIGWNGCMTVEEGGTLTGGDPYLFEHGAGYENCNTFTQKDLQELLTSGSGEVLLSVPVEITDELEIPDGVTLLISGYENYLTVSEDGILTNNGTIRCEMGGGIVLSGGELVNNSDIYVQNWGTFDAMDGTYTPSESAKLYNIHSCDEDGNVTHADVYVDPHHQHIIAETAADEAVILEMVDYVASMREDEAPAFFEIQFLEGAYLNYDLTLPHYANCFIVAGGSLTVPKGVTLTLNGGLVVYGTLIIEEGGQVITNGASIQVMKRGDGSGYGQIVNERGETIDTTDSMRYWKEAALLNDFEIGHSISTVSVGSGVKLWVHSYAPAYAEYYGDFDLEIIDGDGWIENNSVYSNVPGTVTVSVKPTGPNIHESVEAKTIELTFLNDEVSMFAEDADIDFVEYADGKGFFGLYGGNSMRFHANLTGKESKVDKTIQWTVEGADGLATWSVKDGKLTVTASKYLTKATYISVTASAADDSVAPLNTRLYLRPKADWVGLSWNGEYVSGETVAFDLNKVIGYDEAGEAVMQRDLYLQMLVDPADALAGQDLDGKPLYSYSSNSKSIATVDQWGNVHFTGKSGTVKITLTTNFGSKKTASVTFKASGLAQSITPVENDYVAKMTDEYGETIYAGSMMGGKSTTLSVKNHLDAKASTSTIRWYLSDERGNPIASHPYASITTKGKLTTKAVQDVSYIYLMAEVIGNEDNARLDRPVQIALYPAITKAEMTSDSSHLRQISGKWYFDTGAGETSLKLGAMVYPENTYMAYNDVEDCLAVAPGSVESVKWSSSKTSVAEVSQDGTVTVKGSGTAKITLTVTGLDGKKVTQTISLVCGDFVSDVTLDVPEVLNSGDKYTLGAVVEDTADSKKLTWSLVNSADKSYVTLSGASLTAKSVSNPVDVTLVAKSADGWYVSEEYTVRILPKDTALVIQNADTEEYLTQATQLMIPSTDEDISQLKLKIEDGTEVTWKSSKISVATVDQNGVVKATKKSGTATITATDAGNKKRTATVTVKVGKVSTDVKITAKGGVNMEVASGKSLTLIGTVTFTDKSTSTNSVNWSVSDTSVAKITSSGKLTAAKGLTVPTTVIVYAQAKDGEAPVAEQTVTVLPLSTGVEIHGPFTDGGNNVDISNTTQKWDMTEQGESFHLEAGVFPYSAIQDVVWSSSSTKIATVNSQTGEVICKKPGNVTITATAGDSSGKKATFKLSISKTMAYLELPATAFIGGGKTLTMTKLDGYAIDTLASNKTLRWGMYMLDPDGEMIPVSSKIATLSSKGVLKTKAVTTPVELYVLAVSTDGTWLEAECKVTIYPIIKGISLSMNGTAVKAKSTVAKPADQPCIIDVEASTSGTAADSEAFDDVWSVSVDKAAIATAAIEDGQIVVTPTGTKFGKVKITVKANDGSAKSVYFTINFTKPVPAE